MLHLDAVSRGFPDGPHTLMALNEVTLSVAAGEFVAVMGPSGSGKTTLLNIAAGIDRPDRGRVEVDGVDASSLRDAARARLRRRRIGVVHQRANLDPFLTAIENVMLPEQLDGAGRNDARTKAQEALASCGVGDLADRRPQDLSGGQRQRVGVARAIVGRRPILLADEPTAALDTTSARALVELLATLARAGAAVVMTTHDSRLATFADRVVLLRDGSRASEEVPAATATGVER